jgi:hypothetical protein
LLICTRWAEHPKSHSHILRQFEIDAPMPSAEFVRLSKRTQLVVRNLGVVVAFMGEGLDRLFNDFKAQASDLTPTPPSSTACH